MELKIREMHPQEQLYSYSASQQLIGQTGCIGHLRGDFDSTGKGFYTTWDDHLKSLKTDEFKAELDTVINDLRNKGMLKDRDTMAKYCRSHDGGRFPGSYCVQYGFRADTEKYSYMVRCNPHKGDYNLYVYAYFSEWLDRHIKKAEQGIRFINSNYQELFRIQDGESILLTYPDGEKRKMPCRFIDEYHTQVGSDLYHICEFAERTEQSKIRYAPAGLEQKQKEPKPER